MKTKTKPKNKAEELRLDLVNNAPLPNSKYEVVTLFDIENIQFINSKGAFMEVEHYEVGNNKTLIVILK